jgi:chromosome segregation ATPase
MLLAGLKAIIAVMIDAVRKIMSNFKKCSMYDNDTSTYSYSGGTADNNTAIARKENERINQLESLVESYKAKYYEALDEVKRLESELPKLKGVRMENRRLIKANKKLVAKLKGGNNGKGWPE